MNPIISQALVAERVREWQESAARDRLAREALRARYQAPPATAEGPGPRPGSRRPVPRTVEPVVVASRPSALAGDCEPAGRRAA
jgi:hypothetical protein